MLILSAPYRGFAALVVIGMLALVFPDEAKRFNDLFLGSFFLAGIVLAVPSFGLIKKDRLEHVSHAYYYMLFLLLGWVIGVFGNWWPDLYLAKNVSGLVIFESIILYTVIFYILSYAMWAGYWLSVYLWNMPRE